jgi:hypothetical protein
MKRIKSDRYSFILTVSVLVIYFFVRQELLPIFLYLLSVFGLVGYLLVEMIKVLRKKQDTRTIITEIFSYFIYCNVLTLHFVFLYIPNSPNFQLIFLCVKLLNVLVGIIYYVWSIDNRKAMLHLVIGLFGCTWFGTAY